MAIDRPSAAEGRTVNLHGATCVVTGGSRGIGRAIALELAAWGARVVSVGRDRAALDDVAARTGGVSVRADLADAAEVDRAAAEALNAYGRVDVLVNNAGIGLAGPFISADVAAAETIMRVDLLVPIRLTRALLPGMRDRGRGRLVNVASIAGHVGVRDEAVYAAAKGGLIAFSESLRYELLGTGVGVTVVSPGAVRTAFFEREGRAYERRFPRLLSPQRVASATVRAIASDRDRVFVPRWMAFPAWLHGAVPGLYRSLAARYM